MTAPADPPIEQLGYRRISELLIDSEQALARFLAAVALDVCDRYEADDVDDGAMGEAIARLRRIAEAIHA